MSGPKISYYEMTEEQKSIMDRQLKCDNEIVACTASIRNILAGININLEQFKKIEELGTKKEKEKLDGLKQKCDGLKEDKEKTLKEFSEFSSYKIPPKILLSEEEVTRKKQLLSRVKALKKKAMSISHKADELQRQHDMLFEEVKNGIADRIEISTSMEWEYEDNFRKTEKSECVNNTEESAPDDFDAEAVKKKVIISLEKLQVSELSVLLSEKLKSAIQFIQEIQSPDYLKNYCAITVSPLIKACNSYIEFKKEKKVYFDELVSQYSVLCALLDIAQKTFEFSEEGIELLEAEISVLEYDYSKSKEEEYIAETIDEVMKEMGYSLIGKREVAKKRSGKRFRDELYTFKEGTGVNIRYDDNGQISMELGGIDTVDRIPNDSEKTKICGDMVEFCGKFNEFEKRLAAKGVVCKGRIKHYPPSEEFATIVNVSDYDSTSSFSTLQTNTRKIQKKQELKMRRE